METAPELAFEKFDLTEYPEVTLGVGELSRRLLVGDPGDFGEGGSEPSAQSSCRPELERQTRLPRVGDEHPELKEFPDTLDLELVDLRSSYIGSRARATLLELLSLCIGPCAEGSKSCTLRLTTPVDLVEFAMTKSTSSNASISAARGIITDPKCTVCDNAFFIKIEILISSGSSVNNVENVKSNRD
jgi:hypothetical protein